MLQLDQTGFPIGSSRSMFRRCQQAAWLKRFRKAKGIASRSPPDSPAVHHQSLFCTSQVLILTFCTRTYWQIHIIADTYHRRFTSSQIRIYVYMGSPLQTAVNHTQIFSSHSESSRNGSLQRSDALICAVLTSLVQGSSQSR